MNNTVLTKLICTFADFYFNKLNLTVGGNYINIVNPTMGSSLCTLYHISSLLQVGEIMPNKCNLRIKPNNPDLVQMGIEPHVCLQP